jgi:hypothetical protein
MIYEENRNKKSRGFLENNGKLYELGFKMKYGWWFFGCASFFVGATHLFCE